MAKGTQPPAQTCPRLRAKAAAGSQMKRKHSSGKSRGDPYFAHAAAELDNTEPILLGCKTNSAAGLAPSLENFELQGSSAGKVESHRQRLRVRRDGAAQSPCSSAAARGGGRCRRRDAGSALRALRQTPEPRTRRSS